MRREARLRCNAPWQSPPKIFLITETFQEFYLFATCTAAFISLLGPALAVISIMHPQSSRSRTSSDGHEQQPLNGNGSKVEYRQNIQAIRGEHVRPARTLRSWRTWAECVPDILLAAGSTYFIIFAFLVYSRRGQDAQDPINQDLLRAAKYVSTCICIYGAGTLADLY